MVLLLHALDAVAACPNPAGTHRARVTFDLRDGDDDLEDFPVLVRIDPALIPRDEALPGGADLRWFADDEVTELPFEIESWTDAGTSIVWVRVPRVTAGTATDHVFAYWGNPEPPPRATAPEEVWSNGYDRVYHLTDPALDSVDGTRDAEAVGATGTPGMVGDGRSFDGWDDCIDTHRNHVLDAVTVEVWVRADEPPADDGQSSVVGLEYNYEIAWDHSYHPDRSSAAIHDAADWANVPFDRDGPLDGDTWYHLTMAYDGDVLRTWRDGTSVASNPDPDGPTLTTENDLQIGRHPVARHEGESYFGGVIDELRISNEVRSDTWIEASHRSDIGTFATWTPELCPDDGTTGTTSHPTTGTDPPPDPTLTDPAHGSDRSVAGTSDPRAVGCGCTGSGSVGPRGWGLGCALLVVARSRRASRRSA